MKRRDFIKGVMAAAVMAASGISAVSASVNDAIRYIRKVQDFPAPIGGVITLEPNMEYHIFGEINMGASQLALQGGTRLQGHGAILKLEKPIMAAGSPCSATNLAFELSSPRTALFTACTSPIGPHQLG